MVVRLCLWYNMSNMISELLYKTLKLPNLMDIDIYTPKKYRATLVFIHGIGVSKRMWHKIERDFKQDCQIIKVDLLGFGESNPKEWLKYSLEDQAKSLFLTLFKNNKLISLKPVVFVGHSMGSLVATEFASRYPLLVSNLVLISPPIYLQKNNLKEKFLTGSYKTVLDNDQLMSIALKLGQTFFGYTSTMSPKSRQAFSKSLHAAIIKQDVFSKLAKIKRPVNIIYGIFDPVIVADNFKFLPDINPNVKIESTIGMHDVRWLLAKKVIDRLKIILEK